MQILAIHPEFPCGGSWDSGISIQTSSLGRTDSHFTKWITEWLHTIPVPVQSLQLLP